MSARSSSGSWSGAGRAPPDIIDLDKFMRGAVRPSRSLRCGNKLVVDAGGVDRAPGVTAPPPASHAPPTPHASPAPLTVPSDSSDSRPRPHGKRFSHDSGLSDTSYARRKHRPHRRAVGGDGSGPRAPRSAAGGCGSVAGGARSAAGAGGAGGAGSSSSMRAFRSVCERALLEQQAQIARVAQLCERLSERAPPAPAPHCPAPPARAERSVTDSSDVSSSSRSTRDQRRKDKHRTEECKTYKIIMNKLDELNRLFAARGRPPPAAGRAPRPALLPAASRRTPLASSGSVSVSDKLVSTEPDCPERSHDLQVLHNVVTIRGGSAYGACGPCGARGGGSTGCARGRAGTLEAAPREAQHGATESVAQCESRAGTGTSGGDPRCGFDLDDPVHLYSQAKRLQAMSATTRRARSVEPSGRRYERVGSYEREARRSPGAAPRSREYARECERPLEPSLCALCRGYWRSLTNYLAAQFFCCPEADAGALR